MKRKEERRDYDDPFNLVNDLMQFGHGTIFGRSYQDEFSMGFGQDLERMIQEAGQSGGNNGSYHSAQMFSSITTIGDDGVPVSQSRGLSTNSTGRYKMAHQRRIGDRSQTLMRQRQNEKEEFQDTQRLHQITHDELPRFRSEFEDRTQRWNSYRGLKSSDKPQPLAIEDGRRSTIPHSSSRYFENNRRSKSHPRGVEY